MNRRKLEFCRARQHRATIAAQLIEHFENCDLCSKKQAAKCETGVAIIGEFSTADRRYHELKHAPSQETQHAR